MTRAPWNGRGAGRLALALIALLAVPAPRVAAGPTPEFQLPLYGNESVAATDGAWGFTVNPASGGIRYPMELLIALTDLEPSGRLYRGAFSRNGAGITFNVPDGGPSAWGLGFRGGEDRLRGGFTVSRLFEHGGDARATDWSLGLLSRPIPWLSVGAVGDHLFQPNFLGAKLGRLYTLGIGVRPLALLPDRADQRGPRLTLTADLLMAEAAELSQARVRVGAELEVARSLVLRGAIQDHGGFQLGVALHGVGAGYHGSAAFDGDQERLAMTHAGSFHRGEEAGIFPPSRVATVRVGGVLGDEGLAGFTLTGGGTSTRSAASIHRQLERALEDPRTRGVLLELGGAANMAQLEELRPRITRLRRAGKPVVAYLEQGGGRGDLYLAAACDRIVASEEAYFAGLGLRAERRYYRELLADWGIRIDRTAHGKYKSAYRGYSADSTPPADREAIERNLDVSQELLVAAITADRKIERAPLLAALDGRHWTSADLARLGIVDSVGYREDALRTLGQLAKLGGKPRTVNLARTPEARRVWTLRSPIAVVYASGAIEAGASRNDLFMGPTLGAATVVGQLERAFRDPQVRAVVLRVESPGGSGLASNLIDHAVQRLKRETGKPLIVSMGSVAASGGYYISTHADRIYADRFTRTGSIGVVSIRPSLEGLFAKRGVRQDDFERGRYMRGTSIARDWDRVIQASADSAIFDYYRSFVAKVADGRGLEWSAVDAVAQGRVWMGEDALRHGLVDEIGGLEQAIADARRRCGVPEGERIRLIEYRRPRPRLLERLAGSAMTALWSNATHLPEPGAIYYLADAEIED